MLDAPPIPTPERLRSQDGIIIEPFLWQMAEILLSDPQFGHLYWAPSA